MYIVVNSDLKLSVGQIAAQVSHVTHLIVDEIIRTGYESYPVPESYIKYMNWCKNNITIVKKATEVQLLELSKMESARYFYDDIYSKKTQYKNNCLTIVGFLPLSINADMLFEYDLL